MTKEDVMNLAASYAKSKYHVASPAMYISCHQQRDLLATADDIVRRHQYQQGDKVDELWRILPQSTSDSLWWIVSFRISGENCLTKDPMSFCVLIDDDLSTIHDFSQ
jgi:hypothetical protein